MGGDRDSGHPPHPGKSQVAKGLLKSSGINPPREVIGPFHDEEVHMALLCEIW